jgi:hypothetical protein
VLHAGIVEAGPARSPLATLVTTRPSIGDFHEARIMVLAMTAAAPAPTLHPHQQALLLR